MDVWLLPSSGGFSTQLQIRGCPRGAFTYLGVVLGGGGVAGLMFTFEFPTCLLGYMTLSLKLKQHVILDINHFISIIFISCISMLVSCISCVEYEINSFQNC